MMTTSIAVLDTAAKHRADWLWDSYQMAREASRSAEAFVVPAAQWDPGTAVKMINVLRLGGVRVWRAPAFTANGKTYPAGSFIIGSQPFFPYVTDLLTPQRYPDLRVSPGGPPKRPYDITGWTLNYQMGVQVDRVAERVTAATTTVDVAGWSAAGPPSGRHAGLLALDPRANGSFIAVNRLLKAGAAISRSLSPLAVLGEQWPAGTFLVQPDASGALPGRPGGLTVGIVDPVPDRTLPLKAPRIGLYHGWGGNMDE